MSEVEYLTPEEIAEKLRVHPKTVRDWLREGYLKGLRFKGVWRIPKDEFDKFIAERAKRD